MALRFPISSEDEIQAIDEDHDGKISMVEMKALADDMLPELEKVGFPDLAQHRRPRTSTRRSARP